MKTILLINNTASSVLNFRKHLIIHLIQSKYEVYVAASDYTPKTLHDVKQLGATPILLSLKRTGTNPFADIKSFLSICKIIRKTKPDIVFSFFTKPVIYGTLAAYILSVPRIFAMIEGLGYTFTQTPEKESLKKKIVRSILVLLYKITLPKADVVFFLNQDDPKDLLHAYNIKANSQVIGGIGLDLDQYPFSVAPTNPVTFIFIGRLLKEKGILEFLQAAKIVKQKYPETLFYVVGGYDFENSSSITTEQIKPYIEENIIIHTDHVPDVNLYLEKSSVFVLPSYREGFPRSTQEAMAMGRAVITTDVPGCRETVEDGKNGFLIPKWDIIALSDKMEFFITHPEEIISMGAYSYNIARQRYNGNIINKKIIKIIEDSKWGG